MIAGRGQPNDDTVPVPDATLADLDHVEVDRLIDRLKRCRGQVFSRFGTSEVLRMAGVCPRTGDDQVTLAGLLALGVFPQQFFPQLNVTFVSYPTVDGRPMRDGTRFLENAALDGSIPTMAAELVEIVERSMTRRAVIRGAGREDVWEYPIEAIRELTVNAVMHRDYHPLAQGTQVRIEMYPDRLVFINPGGLYGTASAEELPRGTITSSRNAVLARLLEDVEIPGTNRTVCENRGSGMRTILSELSTHQMPPPILRSSGGMFIAELRRPSAADGDEGHRVGTSTDTGADSVTTRGSSSAQEIRRALMNGPMSAADLQTLTGLSRSGVSKQLRALETDEEIIPTTKRHNPGVKWALIR